MRVALAFSGGLDTSFVLAKLSESHEVYTVTVDVGGYSSRELSKIEEKAYALGAKEHYTAEAKSRLWEMASKALAMNALYQGVYPLCCPIDRLIIAEETVKVAREVGAEAVAHGCTAAGNDIVRLTSAFKALAPDLKVLAPVAELSTTRAEEAEYLEKKGFPPPPVSRRFSTTRNLWGCTVYSPEMSSPSYKIPLEEWLEACCWVKPVEQAPSHPEEVEVEFERGAPVSLDGSALSGPELLESLNTKCGSHGFGLAEYTGDCIIGIKGRVGIEAPAAYALIAAHRALESIVLTRRELSFKARLEEEWTNLVFSGLYHEPLLKALEAAAQEMQRKVTGSATIQLYKGCCRVVALDSPYQLTALGYRYGEESMFTSQQVIGFTEVFTYQSTTAHLVQEHAHSR
ncbi:MAG: argininosuccinate synthase [Thermoproteota archaeon]|nr:MAG: argininosuccinate synthase [Candidatus Korarchaeota archaeon]